MDKTNSNQPVPESPTLEQQKLELEREKLKLERFKAVWTSLSIILPLLIVFALGTAIGAVGSYGADCPSRCCTASPYEGSQSYGKTCPSWRSMVT